MEFAQVPHPDTWFMTVFGQAAALTAGVALMPGLRVETLREARKIIDKMANVDDDAKLWNEQAKQAALWTLDTIEEFAKTAQNI